jgi:hypothetical protein
MNIDYTNIWQKKLLSPRRILKRKPSETIEDLNETVNKLKTDIENHINLSRLNQKVKRQNS